jgi:hypothetical protein
MEVAMRFTNTLAAGRVAGSLALIVGMSYAFAAVGAESKDNGEAPSGRINFEAAKLPPASIEVDLSQEMFKDLFGIGDAAIAGVAETLLKYAQRDGDAKNVALAAEQLEAAKQITQLAGNVVREVRVRVYQGLPEGFDDAQALFKPFDEQLQANQWDTLVRVRNEDATGRVSVLRSNGAVHGVFLVVAADSEDIVLANIVCDISPENVKKLTSAMTQIGLQNGLAQAIDKKLSRVSGANSSHDVGVALTKRGKVFVNVGPTPPTPPIPPIVPAPPAKPK